MFRVSVGVCVRVGVTVGICVRVGARDVVRVGVRVQKNLGLAQSTVFVARLRIALRVSGLKR